MIPLNWKRCNFELSIASWEIDVRSLNYNSINKHFFGLVSNNNLYGNDIILLYRYLQNIYFPGLNKNDNVTNENKNENFITGSDVCLFSL